MKHLTAMLLALMLAFSAVPGVRAQDAGMIWMETGQESYGAGETITVTFGTDSPAPIQGFTFALRYDPACLQPATPTSLLPGLNYMAVPQAEGLVDAIFASSTLLDASGSLAEVKFTALAACQTTLNLENASLAIADESGMAVPLEGIGLAVSSLDLNIGGASAPQPTRDAQANPAQEPETNPENQPGIAATPASASAPAGPFSWLLAPMIALLCLLFVVGLIITIVSMIRGRKKSTLAAPASAPATPLLFVRRGPLAGKTLPLLRFPCRIGSDPANEICLDDLKISPLHARITASANGYILVDLGGPEGTYLNGRLLHDQQALLKAGDVLRLGGVVLIFGPV